MTTTGSPPVDRLPKLCGADVELGNFILGLHPDAQTCALAARALLREIEGLPLVKKYHSWWCDCDACRQAAGDAARSYPSYPCAASRGGNGGGQGAAHGGPADLSYDPQDWGRKFLPSNGGSAYIDLNHLEICLPEVLSARDHLACWHAMLRIAGRALAAANAKLPPGQAIQLLANNSDGFGHTYGSHLDFLVTRAAWDNLFRRRLHHLLFLAAYQVSSIVFTGQGKVGGENGAPPVRFQLSQRADFVETLTGEQTTYRRPIVNSRDESLCGRAENGMARLHVIFHDSTLCHVASFLKVGVLQIVLAMIEAGCVNTDLALDDPVGAVVLWSHDPGLTARANLIRGGETTALELQVRFLDEAKRFAAGGGLDGIVPGHEEILALWEDTLAKLAARDMPALARRLDWALKLFLLERTLAERPDLGWRSPEIKHLDLVYGSLDPSAGLYLACERAGLVERLVPDERIERFTANPPEDTRAWGRAMLLRLAGEGAVDDVDWDSIRFTSEDGPWLVPRIRTLSLPSPLGWTRAELSPAFEQLESLQDILDALGARETSPVSDSASRSGSGPGSGAVVPLRGGYGNGKAGSTRSCATEGKEEGHGPAGTAADGRPANLDDRGRAPGTAGRHRRGWPGREPRPGGR